MLRDFLVLVVSSLLKSLTYILFPFDDEEEEEEKKETSNKKAFTVEKLSSLFKSFIYIFFPFDDKKEEEEKKKTSDKKGVTPKKKSTDNVPRPPARYEDYFPLSKPTTVKPLFPRNEKPKR